MSGLVSLWHSFMTVSVCLSVPFWLGANVTVAKKTQRNLSAHNEKNFVFLYESRHHPEKFCKKF